MNTQLTYATNSNFRGFADQSYWMQDSLSPFMVSKTYSKQDVFDMANNCRDNYTPIFANENKYLPSNQQTIGGDAEAKIVITPIALQESKQQEKTQTKDNTAEDFFKSKQFKQGLIIGGGLFVLFKILA